MDPKDNARSNNGNNAQNNGGVPNDGTQNRGFGDSPVAPPDVSMGGIPTNSDQNSPQTQGVEVDLSGAAGTSGSTDPATDGAPDSGGPGLGNDPAAMPSIGGETGDTSTGTGSNPTDVAFGGTQDAGIGQSSLPTDAATPPPADQNFSNSNIPTTPDLTMTGNTGASPTASPLPPIGTDPGAPNQVFAPGPEQQPGGLPPTAPVPVHPHGTDKKTIMVLAGVAVVLIVAIVVLFLL